LKINLQLIFKAFYIFTNMKILIIRFSAIGDIAWTSPVIRCCKMQIPNAEIHFCTKKQYEDLVRYNPYLDKVHLLNNSLDELLNELKAENFDYVIDLHSKIRSVWIKFYLGKPFYTYHKLTFKRFLYTNFKIDLMPTNVHIVDRYLKTVSKLGVINDHRGLDFFINPENEVKINQLPSFCNQGFVALVIGASKITKKLPLFKMLELCEKISIPIVLIGGKEDLAFADQIMNETRHLKIFNAVGKYNLLQSISIIKQASVIFGHDTGLTHIAAAFKKKIYSIWGPTSPKGFEPYMADNIILQNSNLSCRPCSKSGKKKCPKGHFRCMNEIEITI
jgi:ADP-heptose:LPS heptosyltransferase